MKKLVLALTLGMFLFASAASFAAVIPEISNDPVTQTDDDPKKVADNEQAAEEKTAENKKSDKSCEKKCTKKEKSDCSKK